MKITKCTTVALKYLIGDLKVINNECVYTRDTLSSFTKEDITKLVCAYVVDAQCYTLVLVDEKQKAIHTVDLKNTVVVFATLKELHMFIDSILPDLKHLPIYTAAIYNNLDTMSEQVINDVILSANSYNVKRTRTLRRCIKRILSFIKDYWELCIALAFLASLILFCTFAK